MLAAIVAHAREAYPDECCGLVLADGTLRRCVNVHPTPRVAFRLAPSDALFLERSLRTADPARVLYHSHVDAPPALSSADRLCASLHPRLAFVVVSTVPGTDHPPPSPAIGGGSPTRSGGRWRGASKSRRGGPSSSCSAACTIEAASSA